MITIYGTPNCVYCKRSEEYLTLKEIPFEKIDVSADEVALGRMVSATGQMNVPVFEIEDKWIVGYADFMAWMATKPS